jgi:mannan endo-1,4-beta-mannosidase
MTRREGAQCGRATAAMALVALLAVTSAGCALPGAGRVPGTDSAAAQDAPPGPRVPTALPLAGKVEPPATGAYLGAYLPPAPFPTARIRSYEQQVGRSLAIVMWYQPWATSNRSRVDTAAIVAVMRLGKVPMITWEPWDPGNNSKTVRDPGNQRAYRLALINAGQFDGYITEWARTLRALGGPVMLRFMHEMNGSWYPWSGTTNGNSPAAFVAAWRRVHDIFVREGATNVTWVWSVNAHSVPPTTANRYAAYYPGDAYVDWTAISGFNGGGAADAPSWRPYGPIYAASIAYLATLKKPICVSEIASMGGGRERGAWIAHAYAGMRATPQVKAVVYFDSVEVAAGTEDWRVEAYPESLAAFRTAVAPPYWVSSPPAVLSGWVKSLDATQSSYLLSFDPLY